MVSRQMGWTLKSQFIECARLKLKDQHSCWSCHTMKTDRQFFHLLDGGDPGRGGWGCTSVIVLQLALLQAQVLQVVQVLVLGAGRGLRQPVRKDWFLPSTHMHPPSSPFAQHLVLQNATATFVPFVFMQPRHLAFVIICPLDWKRGMSPKWAILILSHFRTAWTDNLLF